MNTILGKVVIVKVYINMHVIKYIKKYLPRLFWAVPPYFRSFTRGLGEAWEGSAQDLV